MLKSLFSTVLLLLPTVHVLGAPLADNRTFTLTVVSTSNNTNPHIINQPVLVSPPQGIISVVVGDGFANGTTQPLKAWIYQDQIYRGCTTSPTGACIGMLSKAFGGALTGWYFDFSDDEVPKRIGAGEPLTHLFSVREDPDAPSHGPCKPKQKVLFHTGDQRFWTLCTAGVNMYQVSLENDSTEIFFFFFFFSG